MSRFAETAAAGGQQALAAKEEVMNFPHRILRNANDLRGQKSKTLGNLKRIKEGNSA